MNKKDFDPNFTNFTNFLSAIEQSTCPLHDWSFPHRRKSIVGYKLFLNLAFCLFFLIGCGAPEVVVLPETAVSPTISSLPTTTATPLPTTIPPTLTPIATSTPPATATPAPTATPVVVRIGLSDVIATAVASYTFGTEITIVTVPEPQTALDAGQVDLALVQGEAGLFVWRNPQALTIPFTNSFLPREIPADQIAITLEKEGVELMDWRDVPADRRVIRIDGYWPNHAQYPLAEDWVLVGAHPHKEQVAQQLREALGGERVVHLTAVGDIMLDRGPGFVISQGNLEYPFAPVAPLLRQADITVGNVESALGDVGEPVAKSYPFQAPPEAAQALALAGFDVVSLANNHGMDYGEEALLQAIDLLREANVQPVGAGANGETAYAPLIQEVNGLRIGFLAYVNVPVEASSAFDVATWTATADSAGLAWGTAEAVEAGVTAVRPQVDLVVVILHSGYEYIEEPSEIQQALSRTAVEAGADLVIGHHAHILQGIQFYQDGVIVYGLGNFAFEIDGDPNTAILDVWLDTDGVRHLELTPAIIQQGGVPRLAEPWEADPILQNVYFLTTLLNVE